MKSGKQRRAELDAKRKARADKADAELRARKREELARKAMRGEDVNKRELAPHGSYSGDPEFVERGFYVDKPFECVDCGKAEVWKASQQKWWYEVAKGNVFTTARRCRTCRRRERERKAAVRRAQEEATAQNLERGRRARHSG